MRVLAFVAYFTLASLHFEASAAPNDDYWSYSCGDLWYARNSIYHRARYCFKTDRAIKVFGNADCVFEQESDLPLPRASRREIVEIRHVEAAKGCRN